MPDEQYGNDPAAQPASQTDAERQMAPCTPQDKEVREKGNAATNNESAKELKREFRVVEGVTIATNVILAIVGVLALRAYYGQLGAMQGQLAEMKHTNELTQKALEGNDKALSQTLGKMQGQVDAADTANALTKKSLVSVQRAFVFPDPTDETLYERDGKTQRGVRVVIKWKNSGSTPTKNLTIHRNVVPMDRMPENYGFPDIGDLAPHPLFIGPQSSIGTNAQEIQASKVNEIAEGKFQLYFYGWAKYHDVFEGTQEHITRYCYQFVVIPQQSIYNMISCEKNNCYDDECKVQ